MTANRALSEGERRRRARERRCAGWIDPDDRLWRHPSEVPPAPRPGPARPVPAPAGGHAPPHRRSWSSSAAAAVVAVAVFVVGPALPRLPTSLDRRPGRHRRGRLECPPCPGCRTRCPRSPWPPGAPWSSSQATTSHGLVVLIGIAVAEGGLVVTTADALGGPRAPLPWSAPAASSRAPAWSARTTTRTVDIVQVPEDVPVAPFAAGAPGQHRRRRLHARPCDAFGPHLVVGAVPGAVSTGRHHHHHRPGQRHARHHLGRRPDRHRRVPA